jgi:hypothetical protein
MAATQRHALLQEGAAGTVAAASSNVTVAVGVGCATTSPGQCGLVRGPGAARRMALTPRIYTPRLRELTVELGVCGCVYVVGWLRGYCARKCTAQPCS